MQCLRVRGRAPQAASSVEVLRNGGTRRTMGRSFGDGWSVVSLVHRGVGPVCTGILTLHGLHALKKSQTHRSWRLVCKHQYLLTLVCRRVLFLGLTSRRTQRARVWPSTVPASTLRSAKYGWSVWQDFVLRFKLDAFGV